MVKLAEWMYKGSTRQPKSSRSAGGGAAGNTLVLGCNGTLTEMQEMDFCKLPISTSVRPPSIGIGTTEVYSIYIQKVCCV